jgi:hypothetical protein
LHTIKRSQGSIDARLRGFPVAAHDAKLRIATAYKKPSIAAWPIIIVIIVHDAPASVVPVAIPPVGVVMPAVVTIIIVPR